MAGTKLAERGAARERMLDAAERLFAECGIDGVSLRQIGAATGQANNSAIQYHFGDKAGLVSEIIARRVAAFEPRRQALLDRATAEGRLGDVRAMLEIIFLPIAETVDADGRHVYAAFMLQFQNRVQYEAGYAHPGWGPKSASAKAASQLGLARPDLPDEFLHTRVNLLSGLFLNGLVDRDNARARGRAPGSDAAFLADLFSMMDAAFHAPPG